MVLLLVTPLVLLPPLAAVDAAAFIAISKQRVPAAPPAWEPT